PFTRSTVLPASGTGLGPVPHPYQESLHVRVGDAPGWRHHGGQWAPRSAGDFERLQGGSLDMPRDVIIIGSGHNGLVTAFYLAKAGFKPLVLERRPQAGGAAVTEEFSPGFRCSTLAHSAGPLLPEIVADMQLARHGLKLVTPEIAVTALSLDGRALTLHNDVNRAAPEIAKFPATDAAHSPV